MSREDYVSPALQIQLPSSEGNHEGGGGICTALLVNLWGRSEFKVVLSLKFSFTACPEILEERELVFGNFWPNRFFLVHQILVLCPLKLLDG